MKKNQETFEALGSKIDKCERYENPHASRIVVIADTLAQALHLAVEDRKSLRRAALLHDIGELVMKRTYLENSGSLTEEERIDLRRHPIIGEQESKSAGADRATQLLVRWHHEWWNGSGYPDALRRDEIPLAARILRVADSYAAITDFRPFRAALSKEVARQHLIEWAGIEFDPGLVTAFLALPAIDELDSQNRVEERGQPSSESGTLFSSFMR